MDARALRRYRAERMLRRDFHALRKPVLRSVRSRLRVGGWVLDEADLEVCYAAAWQALYGLALEGREIGDPPAWLALVAHRRAVEECRSRRRRERVLSPRPPGPELDAELDDRLLIRQLLEGMRARLSARERQAATLCYLQGCSREEAAGQMGISPARMRKLMEGTGRGGSGVTAKVGALAQTISAGTFCEELASTMRALAYGLLDPQGERYRGAELHRRTCPACRRYVSSLRGLAAALPLLPRSGPIRLWAGRASRRLHLPRLARIGGHGSAGTGGAALGAVSASGVTAGGGGGWLLGAGPLGAKLAVSCLVALSLGAGCLALDRTHPGPSTGDRRVAPTGEGCHCGSRRGSVASIAAAAAVSPVPLGPRSSSSRAPAGVLGASREFGLARALDGAPAQAVAGSTGEGQGAGGRAVTASVGGPDPLEPADVRAQPGRGSQAAAERSAEREFSPG